MPGRSLRSNLVLLAIAVLAIGAITANYFYRQQRQQEPPGPMESANAVIGQPRPAFALPDVLGLSHDVSEWNGRVLVVNFWASWCAPCQREMPAFVALQKQYGEHGVQFVGVALDSDSQVKAFFDRLGLTPNYPSLIGGTNAIAVAEAYGNTIGILPYTVVVDKAGRIAYVQYGELTQDTAEQMILNLL